MQMDKLEYYISNIINHNYCNSNDTFWNVYLNCSSNPDVKLLLEFTGVSFESEVNIIVWEFNNPLRLKNTYFCDEITQEDDDIFVTYINRHGFRSKVKCANKEHLSDFLHFINNPEEIGIDVLIDEHIRLSRLIEANCNSLKKLMKERRFLEYRIWGYNNEEKV